MRNRRLPFRSPPARRLCKEAALVPEEGAGAVRQLARELRARQWPEPSSGSAEWRKLSPSAELFVDPECGARCVVRDTGAAGLHRYLWSVTMLHDIDPVMVGRAAEAAEARQQAEAALAEVTY
jgi:hypothetical protein